MHSMVQVAVVVISTVGALVGVLLGSTLSAHTQRRVWRLQEDERSVEERRRIYADYLAAARVWRATTMIPQVPIIGASTFSTKPHADAGEIAIDSLRLRIEVGLITQSTTTAEAAEEVLRANRSLAEARADHPAGWIPDPFVDACRRAERAFAAAARDELGGAAMEWAGWPISSGV